MLKQTGCSETKKFLRILWILAILTVIVGSLLPSNSSPMILLNRLPVSDKIEHFFAYFVLTFLPTIHERRRLAVVAAIGALTLGVGLEYAQLYSGWRDFETGDMLADAIGVFCGVATGIPMRFEEIVHPC